MQAIQPISMDSAPLQIADIAPGGPAIQAATHADNASPSFADALLETLEHIDMQQQNASGKMQAVDAGQSDDLVGAMLASQEASLSFDMLTQVRNKVIGALDELLKMQL